MSSINKEKLRCRAIDPEKEIDLLFGMVTADFPDFEGQPLDLLRAATERKAIKAVFLTDGETICGYALHQKTPHFSMRHLLYFAILPTFRSAGLGGNFLALLKQGVPQGLLLEVEDPDAAQQDHAEWLCRKKRIAFYERNGLQLFSAFRFSEFGHPLRVMSSAQLPSKQDWLAFYRALYNQMYGFPLAEKVIQPGAARF